MSLRFPVAFELGESDVAYSTLPAFARIDSLGRMGVHQGGERASVSTSKFATAILAAILCLVVPSPGAADAETGEQVGRESVDLFFETLVPLLDRASKTELRYVMDQRGLRCRVRKRGKRVDCVVNGRTRFLSRFESDVMWLALLVSVQKGACPAILARTREILGEPGSIEDGWHLWSTDGQAPDTAFRDKVACQLLRGGEAVGD